MEDTLTISQLIAELQQVMDEVGDIPVFHQSDPEGNSYGTLHPSTVCYVELDDGSKVGLIFPYEEDIELF